MHCYFHFGCEKHTLKIVYCYAFLTLSSLIRVASWQFFSMVWVELSIKLLIKSDRLIGLNGFFMSTLNADHLAYYLATLYLPSELPPERFVPGLAFRLAYVLGPPCCIWWIISYLYLSRRLFRSPRTKKRAKISSRNPTTIEIGTATTTAEKWFPVST